MKKLIYLFLVLLIVACSSDSSDDNLSIVGKWQVTSASFETDECFYENEFEFFNDLQGPLQEGWWYTANEDSNGNCIVAYEDDDESLLLKYENTSEGNYLIYFKDIDEDTLFCEANVNGNTLLFFNIFGSSDSEFQLKRL